MKSRRLAFAFALFAWGGAVGADDLPRASIYLEPLRWTDDRATTVQLEAFRGRPVALAMFYTDCSSVCSITLSKLREIEKAFVQRNRDLQIVLVSYDSVHDSPRRLARFRRREALSPERWHLLSGAVPNVLRLARRLRLGSFVDLGDHIVHSFRIDLLDEDGVARKALDAKNSRVSVLFDEP